VRSETVGYIAAVVGLVGMFVGSYAGYHCGIHRELEKAQLQQDFYYSQDVENPGWYRMSAEAKQAAFDDYYAGIAAQDPGYIAGMMGDPWGLLMTVVFGGVGIYYAYRVGSGQGGQSSVWS